MAGWYGDAVKIRLAAPPVDGAANDALTAFLASQLGLPRAAITLTAGATSRHKRIRIDGMSLEQVLSALGLP